MRMITEPMLINKGYRENRIEVKIKMKKLFLIFIALIMITPAFAAVTTDSTDKTKPVSAYYVKEAYNELDSAKQPKLTSSNVTVEDTGTVGKPVTGVEVTAAGAVKLKRSEVTIPAGSATSSIRASIWIE